MKILYGFMAALLLAGGFFFAVFIREIGRYVDDICDQGECGREDDGEGTEMK